MSAELEIERLLFSDNLEYVLLTIDVTKKPDPKAKALKAAKAVKSGQIIKKKAKKIRTKVTFHRPKTLTKARDPKYPRISATPRNKLDHYGILKYPLTTESAMKKIEDNNTLVFIVDIRADKKKIKDAVKKMYDIQTKKVNTLIRPDGTKKAYVRLTPDYDALDCLDEAAGDFGERDSFTVRNTMSSNHQTVMKQLEPWCELKDKVVLLTGASSGIGREICLDLAKSGCKIIAAARRLDRLQSLCSEINAFSTKTKLAAPLELDVSSDTSTIRNAVKQAWDIFGHIDVLINNAGIRGNVKSSLDLSEEEWERVFRTNLTGPWLVSKHVCVLMRDAKRGGGSVINVSSIAGLQRGKLPGALAYACSKGGLDIMTKMMAVEMGEYGIRVNSIAPGLFKSEITEGLMRKEWMKNVRERIVPLKVQQSVDPGLTSLVRYLIHDSSRYVSGNVYIVDAGSTLSGLPIFSSL
ncbi:hypothetical protein HID58_035455 [Brassica napus]|uniref:Large ribosomal subunit protein uL23 N-terminal domain-containing protein n=3 Tax=Brassica TaxID=3705 RepID=A0ABQ8C4Z3_BRANA|nr:hypothetical protein HID58_035455 [Brassica napus]VDC62664.1 unnamed protein product [Brassica rapa]